MSTEGRIWERKILRLEWKSDGVIDDKSGDNDSDDQNFNKYYLHKHLQLFSTYELWAISHMYSTSSLNDASTDSMNGDQQAPFADFCKNTNMIVA